VLGALVPPVSEDAVYRHNSGFRWEFMKNQNGTKEKLCVQLTSKKNNTMFPYIFQNKHDYNMIKPAIISNIYHPNSRVELPSLPDSWNECTNRNKDPKLGTEWTHKITHSWLYNGCLFPKYGRWSWLYIYSNRLALRIFIIFFRIGLLVTWFSWVKTIF
jgi:hypothetical protein